jgi:hypothetical protein
MGGIWQSGAGPAADDQENVYVMTGNGHFQSTQRLPDLADSFVKLENKDGALRLVDWYTPPSRDVMEACDLDLGASGPAVIQDSGRVLGAGKSGILYVLNKEAMGKTAAGFDLTRAGQWRGTPDCAGPAQCFRVAENQHGQSDTQQTCNMQGFPFSGTGFNNSNWNLALNSYPHVHGSPVVWKKGDNDFLMYVWPEEDYLKAYHFDGQTFSTTPVGSSKPIDAAEMSMPGGILSLSWDGTNAGSAIIWASRPNPGRPHVIDGPFINVFSGHDQQHFSFTASDGIIWDAFYCPGCSGDKWPSQQINGSGGVTDAPPAVSGPFVDTYAEHDQQHFGYLAKNGEIWDAFYCSGCSGNKWQKQKINSGGVTDAPPAASGPFVNVFSGHDQQHFAYLATNQNGRNGEIWDAFYCPGCSGGKWQKQKINGSGGVTDAPPAVSGPFVDTYAEHDQQHFTYLANNGEIWDVFYCPGCSGNKWQKQKINSGGATGTPPAASAPFVNAFSGHDQQHFAYKGKDGGIWDAFYCPGCSGDKWQKQEITVSICMLMSSNNDLTPNDAPCNAINKIVHGYVEAFQALPGSTGLLRELWNSEINPGDSVEWFAKDSLPTIADGKVFVAEFPNPIGSYWNSIGASGRLIVYATH